MKKLKESAFVILILVFIVLIIYGEKIDRSSISTVKITGVVENNIGDTVKFHGPDSTYITTLDTVTGIFEIEFEWDSSAYLNFFHGVESTRMYANPNDEIHLSINTEEFDESIQYTGSRESSFLAWQYLHEEEQDYPDFYGMEEGELDSALSNYFDPYINRASRFEEVNPAFYESFIGGLESSKNYIRQRREALAALPKPGEDPFDFTFPDRDGNDVSLSDFVGSVVYVDVWATWCGPCRMEIPHLLEIEEEYADKNVKFLGVSVDDNKEAWTNMIDDKGLHGTHICTGGWKSQMMDDYAINGIPRFMVFDANGKVADLNAPRPSSDEIRPLLDSLLSKE